MNIDKLITEGRKRLPKPEMTSDDCCEVSLHNIHVDSGKKDFIVLFEKDSREPDGWLYKSYNVRPYPY